jgi:glutamate synthase (NADPH/NADH) small chain
MKLRTSSSQEEGVQLEFSVLTRRMTGENGRVTGLEVEREGQLMGIPADLVLLAMGFLGPRPDDVVGQAGVALSARGTVAASVGDYRTSSPRVFACGDMRRGQSLVVWAIREGRQCAAAVHDQLVGRGEANR